MSDSPASQTPIDYMDYCRRCKSYGITECENKYGAGVQCDDCLMGAIGEDKHDARMFWQILQTEYEE